MAISSALLAIFLMGVVKGQLNPGQVCVPTQGSPSKRPPLLPDTFQTRLEVNIKQKAYTMDMEEYFDYPGNRGVIRQRTALFDIRLIYSYTSREMYLIDNNGGSCKTISMTGNLGQFMGKVIDGKYRIFSVNEALKSITKVQEYKGVKIVRGIKVDWWSGCLYAPDTKASMVVEFYYNAKDSWDLVVPNNTFPVQIHVKGKIWRDSKQDYEDFENFYNFYQFRPSIEVGKEIFQTDAGIICPGRKITIPPPQIPQAFKFKMELIDNSRLMVTNLGEWYDFKQNLARFDLKLPGRFYQNPVRVVHDYNTGVSYMIDRLLGNCSYRPIAQWDADGTWDVTDPTLVRLRNPQAFFRLDGNYTYEGTRTVRDVPSDVWIGRHSEFFGLFNTTMEWYFSTKDINVIAQNGRSIEGRVPWRLDITLPNGVTRVHNIYDFASGRQSIFNFDISPCFIDRKRADMQFKLDAQWKDVVTPIGMKLFRYYVLISLQGTLAVTPIRISNLRLDYDDDGDDDDGSVIVTFTLLDTAPINGTTITLEEVSVEDATQGLESYIKDGSFQIIVINNDLTTKKIDVRKDSFKKVIRVPCGIKIGNPKPQKQVAQTGLSTGAFAGVVVGVLVLGLLLGVAGLYGICLIKNRRSKDDMHVQFKNEDASG